ncbi:hypothetical protein G9X48_11985 [Cronobacter sp. HA18006]|uniref:hypothetical protein n=1 Tax=Cronobacter TaxID=413496 RepID=UPI000DA1BE82|nr:MULTISPECIES: hypothetical protein [Cronobacter]EGT5702094.1 hypothetical protein [Cronobacter sakazakii]EJG0827866.1 hypothetical protein [Cronobacter sakazakii]MDI7610811.1 hypothetical protein [Cronobacter sakazakii]MDI7616175.1 hypothetical protein [Cronobacter sakazakii]NHW96224.1 hypothetical protein [Cronobacter sp. HA18006]
MAERWIVYLIIGFIALAATPVSMAAAKIDVPVWALIAGHVGSMISGVMAAELSRKGGEA